MESNDYAVFIISHGRPECRTYKTMGHLPNCYIVCDDEDELLGEYQRRYGERVVVFNRERYVQGTDWGFNKVKRNHAVFARNAVYDIAREKGFRYFFVVDDDFRSMAIRFWGASGKGRYKPRNLGRVMGEYAEFLKVSHAAVVGVAGGREFIGGGHCGDIARTARNFYCCDAEQPLNFGSVFLEDTSANVLGWMQGKITIVPLFVQASFRVGEKSVCDYENDWAYNFSLVCMTPATSRVARKKERFSDYVGGRFYPMIIDERWKK